MTQQTPICAVGGDTMAGYTRRLDNAGQVGYPETNKAVNIGFTGAAASWWWARSW